MQKCYYDIGSKSLPPLAMNDHVRVRWANTWSRKARVLEEVGLHSLLEVTEDGAALRRNQRDLLHQQEVFVADAQRNVAPDSGQLWVDLPEM